MTSYQLGILFALAVAVCWTSSALAFSVASRRVGSVPVNLIRLVIALVMLTLVTSVTRDRAVPTDATAHQFTWLAISGIVGFFIGDLTLFRAFVLIGPRRATLIMSLAPAFAALGGWLAFDERLNPMQSIGIFVTLVGEMWVVAERSAERSPAAPIAATSTTAPSDDPLAPVPGGEGEGEGVVARSAGDARDRPASTPSPQPSPPTTGEREHAHVSRYGIFLGFAGAAGQGIGAVMVKHAYLDGTFDAFASTQIRAAVAIPLFAIFLVVTGRSSDGWRALRDRKAMAFMTLGAFAGPFLGVSSFNASIARVPSGVTSMVAGMVPVFMLPVAAIFQHERITIRAASGAVVAVAGVALLVLGG